MLFLHTVARAYWPFLGQALSLMEKKYPSMTNNGFTLQDPLNGFKITFEPRPKWENRLILTVEKRGKRKPESFVFGTNSGACYRDMPYRTDRGRWPLPWLMRGVMRKMFNRAMRSEYAFS